MARCLAVALAFLLGPSIAVARPAGPAVDVDKTAGAGQETTQKKKKKKKKKRRPRVSGFVQVFYRYAFETGEDGVVDNDHFRVLRARVKVKGKVVKKVGYTVEIDPRAPEVTGIMRDAYIAFRHLPRHELRVGQQKTQFGYENRVSSSRLYAVNRSEYADALARGKNLRDIGLGIVGSWPLTDELRLEDAFNLVNGNGFNTQADDTDRMSVWGRVGLRYKTPSIKIWFGVSGARGDFIDEGDIDDDPADDFLQRFVRGGADVRVDHRWFFASAEAAAGVDDAMGESEDVYGGYLNVVGKSPWNAGPIVRVDTYLDEFRRFTFGAYYGLADDRLRFMINYEYRQVFDDARGDDKLYVWTQGRF